MMMALPFSAPPTHSMAPAVVRVNSSIFLRVPEPALFELIVATISPYLTLWTRDRYAHGSNCRYDLKKRSGKTLKK
jgi:hypothetical protein